MINHPNAEVRMALARLCDALQSTGRQSALVLCERDGFVFRAKNGKPEIHDPACSIHKHGECDCVARIPGDTEQRDIDRYEDAKSDAREDRRLELEGEA